MDMRSPASIPDQSLRDIVSSMGHSALSDLLIEAGQERAPRETERVLNAWQKVERQPISDELKALGALDRDMFLATLLMPEERSLDAVRDLFARYSETVNELKQKTAEKREAYNYIVESQKLISSPAYKDSIFDPDTTSDWITEKRKIVPIASALENAIEPVLEGLACWPAVDTGYAFGSILNLLAKNSRAAEFSAEQWQSMDGVSPDERARAWKEDLDRLESMLKDAGARDKARVSWHDNRKRSSFYSWQEGDERPSPGDFCEAYEVTLPDKRVLCVKRLEGAIEENYLSWIGASLFSGYPIRRSSFSIRRSGHVRYEAEWGDRLILYRAERLFEILAERRKSPTASPNTQ